MKLFDLDKQTIKDLELFADNRSDNSISKLYSQTKTHGAKNLVDQLMRNPVADIQELRQRTALIQFLAETGFDLKINSGQFEFIDRYHRLNVAPLKNNVADAFLQNLFYKLKPSNDYFIISSGIQQIVYLLVHLKEQIKAINALEVPKKLAWYLKQISTFVEKPDFNFINNYREKISFTRLNKLDYLFRRKYKKELLALVEIVYELDAYITIAAVLKQNNFTLPEYSESVLPNLFIDEFHHPLVKNAVPYSIQMDESTNLCFLTGPNMAGKSTFLKAVGLTIYLAHLGFPVPAKQMTTSIYNGIVTTINLSDDRNLGYSHFYSEVNRIKETLLKIKNKKRLFVIFDELFRGTNVKDAFDGSLLIIKSFANIPKSAFFISTHITEVAEKVKDIGTIQFNFFDSKLVANKPVYNYKLEKGISHERMGMYILKSERIIELLDSMTSKQVSPALNG